MKFISCNSNISLSEEIAKNLDIPLTKASVRKFSDEEIFVERGHIASLSKDDPIETNVFKGKVFWIGEKPIIAGDR